MACIPEGGRPVPGGAGTDQDGRGRTGRGFRHAAACPGAQTPAIPTPATTRELGEKRRHLDLRELAILKLKHGLSMQAWACRAEDLGIIDEAHCRSLFAEFSAKGWRKEEPVKYEGSEKPTRLRQLTVRAF